MKILIIDNYDSFTFNLVQLVGSLGHLIQVKRNDEISIKQVSEIKPDKIVISPGPGKPEDSKISLDIIKEYGGKIPILGVCLGHQAIAISFGAKVIRNSNPIHGKTSSILHDNQTLFAGVAKGFLATRYHSLTVERESVPDCLEISAEAEDGTIMGIRHKKYSVEGIQFHPESILTIEGKNIIKNWLNL